MTKATNEMGDGELSRCVAVEVMGWTAADRPGYGWPITPPNEVPPCKHPDFATDIAAAFEVAEKMRTEGHGFDCGWPYKRAGVVLSPWWARIGTILSDPTGADTLPRAICLAALQALRSNKEKPE